MQNNLGSELLIEKIGDPIAAADDIDESTPWMDMSGYQGVLYVVPLTDTVEGGVASLIGYDSAIGGDDPGEEVAVASATAPAEGLDNLLLTVNLYKPRRYVSAGRRSATSNIGFGVVIAERYGARKSPVVDSATVADEVE